VQRGFCFVRKKERIGDEVEDEKRGSRGFDESRIQPKKRSGADELGELVLDESQIQSNDPPKNRKIIQSNSADGGGGGRVNSLVNSNKI